MRYTGTVTASFDAGHFLPNAPRCGVRHHGHRYHISAVWEGRLAQSGYVEGLSELQADLDTLVAEFQDRDIHEMMPGVVTDVHGIARYIMERLVGDWPGIASVTVSDHPAMSGTVTREPL